MLLALAGCLAPLALFFITTLACIGQTTDGTGQSLVATNSNAVKPVDLRGRVVCLPEEMHRGYGVELPTGHEHLWAIKTADGKLYTLLRTKSSEAVFLDEQIRSRELLLKARVFPNTQVVEIIRIHSLRDGVEQDLYYYCDVCSIKSVAPEICACCQGPVRLVEKPLTDKSERN